jgi:hypothetical protein
MAFSARRARTGTTRRGGGRRVKTCILCGRENTNKHKLCPECVQFLNDGNFIKQKKNLDYRIEAESLYFRPEWWDVRLGPTRHQKGGRMYCPKCKSKLYPADTEYMRHYGICSYCYTFGGKISEEDANALRNREKQAFEKK